MKKIFLAIILLVGAVGLYYWNFPLSPEVVMTSHTNGRLYYSFQYRHEPNGYVMNGIPGLADYRNLLEGLMLMKQDDYASIERGEREGGEGPPTINIYVFSNPRNLSLEEWLEAEQNITNINLKTTDLTESLIDGERALEYEADGLYPSRNVVTTKNNFIYFISGSYLDKESFLYRDLDPFLESIDLK